MTRQASQPPKPEAGRPRWLRPQRGRQAVPRDPGQGLVAIDNPDDADIYPPTRTPDEGARRRDRGFPPRVDR